ncbi:AraC family transcriptional regulator [Streptomyces sp. WAC 06738]|nr:AraC family transcriptional regulator [Streptomyces sp. WAC 06738]
MNDSPHPMGDDDWVPGREHGSHWLRTFTPPTMAQRPTLVCTTIGAQPRHLLEGPRRFDHHVALVIASGSGRLSWGGREPFDVIAPVLLWLPPGVEHHCEPREPGWWECFVGFTGPAASARPELGHLGDIVVPLSSEQPPRRAVRKLATVCNETEPHYASSVAAALHEFLATLRRCRADVSRYVPTVLERFADAACLPISVPEHVRRLSLSADELRDAVGRTAGCSPKEFILAIRLNLAKDLLATTDLTVAAIARRVGYDDQGYFTRLFTKRVGMPPSSFRRRHAQRS